MTMSTDELNTTEKQTKFFDTMKVPKIIYGLYLASVFLPILSIVGVVFAYVFMDDSVSDAERSHFRFQIRTFWMAILFWCISFVLMFIFIGAILWFITGLWLLIRVVTGLKAAYHNKPIVHVKAWMFDLG